MHQATKRVLPPVAVPLYLLLPECSRQQAAVELGFESPIQVFVVAEHPMHWVVDQVGPKVLHLVYFPVGSIPVVEAVVPDVANLKMPQYLPFSSFR